ncbi:MULTISPECIES: autotransporter domain-containing protein [unclassified Campylobacter]|uniref:autotransporter domain-containing protein n=1 Tax=unclassified Campylobacter TaxID=2593542 RepID=UPI003D3478AD
MKKQKRILLSIALASALSTCAFSQDMNVNNFHYRDYLDLGQNKGVFSNTIGEVILKAKDGSEFKFARVPSQAARTIDGSITSLGRNYAVTADHTKNVFSAISFDGRGSNSTTFGQTNYKFLTGQHATSNTGSKYSTDTLYIKTTKYIVEGEISPADIDQIAVSTQITRDNANENIAKIGRYLQSIDGNNDGKIVLYQAGTGYLELNHSSNLSGTGNYSRGGGIFDLSANTILINFSNSSNNITLSAKVNQKFTNNTTTGDSGSGFYLYDGQKWVLIGVLRGHLSGDANWIDLSYVTKQDFEDYVSKYESRSANLEQNKDNIISNNQTFNIATNQDLGYGGIVVESGTTTINGTGSLKFAGFDIAENASANLNTKIQEDLHKIGAGTLNVGVATGTNLRLGNGEVVLNTDNAFNKIYVTSGRATLKLADSITSFNADNLFFGNGGGKLDLNGKSIEVKNFSANDSGANVINSSQTDSTITLKGNENSDTIVHTAIGGSDKNKINLKVESTNDKTLVFNANTQIDGTLSVTNSKVAIHGHPTTHAIKTSNTSVSTIKQYDKNIPEYMDLERPSTLAQPDWDKVKFEAKQGVKLENSTLSIGKESEFNSDITANGASAINFGGDIEYFIDKLDGSNTQNGGLSYAQQIENQKLDEKNQGNDTIKFSGTITATGTTAIKSSLTQFAPTLKLSENATLKAKNLTISDANKVDFAGNSKADIDELILKNISNSSDKLTKAMTATLKVSKSLTLDNAKNLNLNNNLVSNLNELNLIAKNGSLVEANEKTSLKGLSLDASTYSQKGTGELSINGGNIELKNGSILTADTLKLENFTNENFKITDSTFGIKNLEAKNSTINITTLNNNSILENLTASGNSEITLKTWDENKFDNLKTQDSAKINLKELSFDMSNEKSVNTNIAILDSLTLNGVGLFNGNDIKINTIKFNNLTFADALKIELNFSDVLKENIDKIDYEKDYEIIVATNLNGKTPYVKLSNGIFATSFVADNKLKVKFTKEDPKSENALKNLTDNQNNELLKAIISHTNSGASPELAAQIELAAHTKDVGAMKEILQKTESELKNISENSDATIANSMLFSSNLVMNSRLAHLKFTPKLTMQNAFKYALASGSNDDVKKVFEAIEANKAKNSFWYNFGGGYFKENSSADMKFYSTNIGYDKLNDVGQGSVIYGAMAGFSGAKYKAKNYQDNSKAYNIGIYADYENTNAYEATANLSLIYIKSEKNFTLLNNQENAKNNGYGVLLSTYHKYRFDISDSQSIKPLVAIEADYTKMDGFKTQNYKQDKLSKFGVSLGLGAEYNILNSTQAHTIQAIAKKRIHRSNNNVKLNLSQADSFLEYKTDKTRVKYELNYIGETKLNEGFTLQYNIGGNADFKGSYGGKAGVKLEYKF